MYVAILYQLHRECISGIPAEETDRDNAHNHKYGHYKIALNTKVLLPKIA